MEPGDLDADAVTWIRRSLREHHVDEAYVAFVARHLTEPDANWRWCCGSHCDPCVQSLGRVVDAAREAFAIVPPTAD